MSRTRRLLLVSLLLLGGCRGGPVTQETDRVLLELASRPFDVAPTEQKGRSEERGSEEKEKKSEEKNKQASSLAGEPETDIHTVSLLRERSTQDKQGESRPKYELKIPPGIPGSEVPLIPRIDPKLPIEQKARLTREIIKELYRELPPLPEEPTPLSGPSGQPYDLADFQKLAAENSPLLRQAVSDVKVAEGALVQAKTYQNPTVAYQASPTNNNSNAGAQGGYINQPLRMWGKMKLGIAAAQKDLDNAQLALRRARFDLSTNVRNAYFALIVAKETMRVNRALARFTNEIYRLYIDLSAAGTMAPYEPAPLRASAYTARLAYQQAIYGYIAAWKSLVAILGLHQLPLTEVAGRVDQLIPYYDYDKVLAYVLANHTDVLTARNGVQKAQYNLKLAQITPYPDIDVLGAVWKESTIPPYAIFYQAQIVMPIPVWDRNKGNIISAQAALIRAVEETHRVENVLTNTLATNFNNYQSNLKALEFYRLHILPDQILYYRGIYERRLADPTVTSPADLVTAQAGLAASVQNYLGILGSLWTSVVSVADLIQTPDLFQKDLAIGRELPALPNLDQLPTWLCPHQRLTAVPVTPPVADAPGSPPVAHAPGSPPVADAPGSPPVAHAPGSPPAACPTVQPVPVPMLPPVEDAVLPAPRKNDATPPLPSPRTPQAKPADLNQQLLEPPPEIPKGIKNEG